MSKTKRQRFETVAQQRVQIILDKLELLSNCSNRNNYDYSESDVKKMFLAIRDQLKRTEIKFDDELKRKKKRTFNF